VPTVDAAELPAELPEHAVVLDVREPREWEAGHAPGALHIPLGELAGRLGELPADAPVYAVCRGGGRSSRATAFLNANGWDAVNVGGGMAGWAAAGRPLICESGPAEVI
jgi:rhodanese-related sulfurtransferase